MSSSFCVLGRCIKTLFTFELALGNFGLPKLDIMEVKERLLQGYLETIN